MWDYDQHRSFPVTRVPNTLIQQFDIIAKRIGINRSVLIKLLMQNMVQNAKFWFERHCTTEQFTQHAINDTLRQVGVRPFEDFSDLPTGKQERA